MMRASHAGICVVLALLVPAQQRIAGAPASCESLSSLQLPNANVTLARVVAAGTFTPPSATPGRGMAPALARAMAAVPTFCRVAVTSRPTADSDIKIEVWLPATDWNGKFMAVGNGGWAGSIGYPAPAGALPLRYSRGSTHTRHPT